MSEKRNLSRIKINNNLRVFDNETDALLGYASDVNFGGLMLIGESHIETHRMHRLRMEIPVKGHKTEHISLEAESLWSRQDADPEFYDTGFRLIDPTPNAVRMIRQLIDDVTI